MGRLPVRLVELFVLAFAPLAACRVGYDASGQSSDAQAELDGASRLDGSAPPEDGAPGDGSTPPPPLGDAARPDATAPLDARPETDAGPDAGPGPGDTGPGPLDAGPCGPVAPGADYCTSLPRLAAEPVLDGLLECGLALQPIVPRGWTSSEHPIPAGTEARYAFAWRPDGIYAFLDVSDPRRTPPPEDADDWCGAGAELYVDDDGRYEDAPFYDDPGTRQLIAAAPLDDTTASTRGEIFWTDGRAHDVGPWRERHVVIPRPGGYVLEAFVTADDLELRRWTLSAGRRAGLDVAINVARVPPEPADCGERLGQYFLRMSGSTDSFCEGLPHCDVRGFCNPMLVE